MKFWRRRHRRVKEEAANLLLGSLDGLERGFVGGWAAMSDGSPVKLLVYVGGEVWATIDAANDRPDLAHLFNGKTRFGFHFNFQPPIPEGAEVSVTDLSGNHLPGSPRQVPTIDTRWLSTAVRWGLSKHFISGCGIEVGAAANPTPVSDEVRVTYVDRFTRAEIQSQHPELANYNLIEPDIVSDGMDLAVVGSGSQDFVIANHMIEHAQDPISVLKSFFRVLREGGVLFLTIPDKRFTFDKDRNETSISHLIEDHEVGPTASRLEHYGEWARLHGESLSSKDLSSWSENLDIHYHVWTPLGFLSFIEFITKKYALGFDCELMIRNRDEFVVILRKCM